MANIFALQAKGWWLSPLQVPFASVSASVSGAQLSSFHGIRIIGVHLEPQSAATWPLTLSFTCHTDVFMVHWLPINFRAHFSILVLTFRALHDQAPVYICELLHPYISSRILRSCDQDLLALWSLWSLNRTSLFKLAFGKLCAFMILGCRLQSILWYLH